MSRIDKTSWLFNTKIAHRGLWDENIPENSMLAFNAGVKSGYAMEIDVYMTTDKQIVVFHDDNLERMTGDKRNVVDCSIAELKALRLNNTTEQIPTLKELLAICEGKTPLLIEIKSESMSSGELEGELYTILKDYKGEFAVQSFNPFSVQWFTDNAPHFIRGQLASYFKNSTMVWWKKFLLKNMFFNSKTKPDFVSYDEEFLPNHRIKKGGKYLIIGWTLTSQKRQDELSTVCDNFIFENYIPRA